MPDRGACRFRALGVAATATLALALGACTSASTGTRAVPAPGASSVLAAAAASAADSATPSPPSPTPAYPSDYLGAVVLAYANHDVAYLTLLTSASTASEMAGWGAVNMDWHGVDASTDADQAVEDFYNDIGDWLQLSAQVTDLRAHAWHAADVFGWDPMSYPSGATTYVKHFVDAWLVGNTARMSLLSSAGVTAHYESLAVMPDGDEYQVTVAGKAATTTTVVVSESGDHSVHDTFTVANAKLGGAHAIQS